MKPSIQHKLQQLVDRHEELGHLLGDPGIIQDKQRFREYSKEYANLEKVTQAYVEYKSTLDAIQSAKEMQTETDAELRALAEELHHQLAKLDLIEKQLEIELLPKDPNDERNIYLEIRAGTGGDEAAIFVGDLFRMYSRYAQTQQWQVEIINESHGEHGGYREIIARIIGQGVYSQLKFESGAHRVQRVPETEAQGRIHTSACTVAILPEADEIDDFEINPADLKVDTYRASGAGGQHVNKTDSAIRITHLPTGTVVECQDERSQHKNRARAMSLLKSRLLAESQQKQQAEIAASRKLQVGSGDRSERIRTYNFPQRRVTDHRINLTLYKLDAVMEGDMREIIQALMQEHQTELLAQMSKESA